MWWDRFPANYRTENAFWHSLPSSYMASPQSFTSSLTQGLSASQDDAIFSGESLLQPDKPLGTSSYQTSSRSVLIPSRWLAKIFSVKWPCSPWVLVAQWIQRPPGVREVMGSIPVFDSDFSFVPYSCHVDQFTFHIGLALLHFFFAK